MDAQSLSEHRKPGIATEAYSSEFLCKLPSIAKHITQLKKTGANFSVWERQLKFMIHNLTGSSDYLLHELHKYDPKLNRAVLNLIFWSIDEELQQDLNIDGSAGDAFQVLLARCQSYPLTRADFPEEILDNIVNLVYQASSEENDCIEKRRLERMIQAPATGSAYVAYLDHCGPPILNTFQNLAVVNRRFHRLCLPKLWEKIQFPSALPAPISLWTEDILLRHGHLVRSLEFRLEDDRLVRDMHQFESERSLCDNTGVVPNPQGFMGYREKYGIGLGNVGELFKSCPSLASVSVTVPSFAYHHADWIAHITMGLKGPFRLIPQLQHLKLKYYSEDGISSEFVFDLLRQLPSLVSLELCGFKFRQKPTIEKSLGWNLGQHQKLRKVRFDNVTCEDGTWTLNSWPQRFENITVVFCSGLSPRVLHGLLSGSAPSLTELHIMLGHFPDEPHVNVQFDIPALKELSIIHSGNFDLLLRFENCKNIEAFYYSCPIDDDEWNSMKRYLSKYTWPKLSLLDFRPSIFFSNNKESAKMDVKEIWNSFKIKLLVNVEID
ncbi:uncharacterized protein MELLADRAFT_79115 [Melampsora larici-populina 98AG31]|uniref:Uncharacterized protein n=1 Tax=Melampsora larici-populina (strain 98AG31 / pathotype 3-4-7) TaxID=747676 RepID=F4S312_MELLP|nr:uncharacterized protein MELLADRAFT_79115 [Melampsora larici-populina 98AG31]EGG00983.1 hypothetical protein MELLADRAFT_79115 [Melampsora larici-populina 98AG31]